eukprot:475928-Pyramimonas_sp.AAC.1
MASEERMRKALERKADEERKDRDDALVSAQKLHANESVRRTDSLCCNWCTVLRPYWTAPPTTLCRGRAPWIVRWTDRAVGMGALSCVRCESRELVLTAKTSAETLPNPL